MFKDTWALEADIQEANSPPVQFELTTKMGQAIARDVNGNLQTDISEKWEGDKVDRAEVSLLNKMIRRTLVRSRHEVEVLQRDPTSPLFSVKTFEELRLKPELLKGVYSMGFNRPSMIQEKALPMMLAQPPQNLIAQSQSGTGKTAAFSLAMLSHVKVDQKWTQVLCIAPTYELALQIGQVMQQMGKFCPDIKLAYAVRGCKAERGSQLEEQIVVGTPGTILDWCNKYKVIEPKKITMFVLDEADVMIATQGHRDQSIRVHRQLPKDCQMLFLSATFEEEVWRFAELIVPEPNIIRLRRKEETLDTIKQFYVLCGNKEDKLTILCDLYATMTVAQAMIFCHTRKMASWLSTKLANEGHSVALLSGELTVMQRASIIERFRDGKEKVLVTTNVCSRGIDVEQVSLVVNFDLPVDMAGNADNETYLHRIGRTGRFGRRGFAINMVDSESGMDVIRQIEMHFDRKILKLDTRNVEEIEKQLN
ncbi:ATP-dependent RNA helicase DDX19A-like isoform X1 [Syngnathus scovelli]|uniref:ATP-dependent RNA helicase DDX19A-like isoform X1 n=2 Tax=Syngnathus scovelli TaxID=161590 RepID=UPI00210FA541|nr:ATP-dependent RNA helicase DDX19A-like isoform X1 [Syngnathus scovelli]